jgi:hypothetical protein
MRNEDSERHPIAALREKKNTVLMLAHLVIAGAGLAAVFLLHEVYLGFFVALVSSGIVTFEKAVEAFKGRNNG